MPTVVDLRGGVLAVLFPILVLISTATRLAADRREERFAALRLVGGTPGDVRAMAAVESVLSALSGTAAGIVVFLLVRPLLAGAVVIARYFPDSVMPTWWEFAALLVAVPATASMAAMVSLRRVEVSPLGVARRTSPEPPAARRLIPLAAGVGLYLLGLVLTSHQGIGSAVYPGLILTMIGLVLGGPWLTAQAARLLGSVSRSSSVLLASRRLADSPRTAFRAVTGLVLAVAAGGGLVDRKRPFTLLRVSGTPVRVLSLVVLFEAAVPLATATVIAAAIAYGTSMLAFVRLAPAGTPVSQLGAAYYLLMGIGLAIALAVIAATLPLLRRMTAPATVRFE